MSKSNGYVVRKHRSSPRILPIKIYTPRSARGTDVLDVLEQDMQQLNEVNADLEHRIREMQSKLETLADYNPLRLLAPSCFELEATKTTNSSCILPNNNPKTDSNSTPNYYAESLISFQHELKNAALGYGKTKNAPEYISRVYESVFNFTYAASIDEDVLQDRNMVKHMLRFYAQTALELSRESKNPKTERLDDTYLVKEAGELAQNALNWYEKLS
jgi:hypothetical protein